MEWLFAIAVIGFLISLASLYLLVWFVRKYRIKGVLVALLVGALGVSFINASVPDQQECTGDGNSACGGAYNKFGLLNSPLFWYLFALLNPEAYENMAGGGSREGTRPHETLSKAEHARLAGIFGEIQHCKNIAENTGRYDTAVNKKCREQLAARHGMMREDLSWIEREGFRGSFAAPPDRVARLDVATKQQVFAAMRRCEDDIHEETSGYVDDYFKKLLDRCWDDIAFNYGLDRDDLDWIDREGYLGTGGG